MHKLQLESYFELYQKNYSPFPKDLEVESLEKEIQSLDKKKEASLHLAYIRSLIRYNKTSPSDLSISPHLRLYIFEEYYTPKNFLEIENEFKEIKKKYDNPKYQTLDIGKKENEFLIIIDKLTYILIDFRVEQCIADKITDSIESKNIHRLEKQIDYLKAIKLLKYPKNKYILALRASILNDLTTPFTSEVYSNKESNFLNKEFYPFSDEHIDGKIIKLEQQIKKDQKLKTLLSGNEDNNIIKQETFKELLVSEIIETPVESPITSETTQLNALDTPQMPIKKDYDLIKPEPFNKLQEPEKIETLLQLPINSDSNQVYVLERPLNLTKEIKDESMSITTLNEVTGVKIEKVSAINSNIKAKPKGFYTFDLSLDNNKLKMLYHELIKLEIVVTKNCEIDFIKAFNHTFINNPNEINKIEWESYTYLAVFVDKYIDVNHKWKYTKYLFDCKNSIRMILYKAKKDSPLEYNKKISIYDDIFKKLV